MIKLDSNKTYNIIIAGPNRLGDTVFCTPIFRLLKTNFPKINIDLFASTKLSASVLENNPYLQTIYVDHSIEKVKTLVDKYDLAIDLSTTKILKDERF